MQRQVMSPHVLSNLPLTYNRITHITQVRVGESTVKQVHVSPRNDPPREPLLQAYRRLKPDGVDISAAYMRVVCILCLVHTCICLFHPTVARHLQKDMHQSLTHKLALQ